MVTERDGLNISSLLPQSMSLNSVPYRASQIMTTARQNVRNNITPLTILRRYICPSPHRRSDSMTATVGLRGFVGPLFVMEMPDAAKVSLHSSGDEDYSKYNDATSCKGDGLD